MESGWRYLGVARWWSCAAIVLLGAVEAASGALRHVFAIRNRARAGAEVREAIVRHALELDAHYHDRLGAGELISRADRARRARRPRGDRPRRGNVGARPADGGRRRARAAVAAGFVEVASHDVLVRRRARYARLWASWEDGLGAAAAGA